MLPPFEIVAPTTLADAVSARRSLGEDAALYAGGTELVLVLKEGLGAWSHLIDVKAIPELHELARVDDAVRIGAAVTHRQLERSALIRETVPLLAETEGQIANPRVRAVGTLGGNLAFAEPRSDPATTLLVYDAHVVLVGATTSRTLPLDAFLRGSYETALAPDELLVSIVVPVPRARTSGAYVRFGQHERPTLGVAARLDVAPDGRSVTGARVAVGCVAPAPVRLAALESALAGAALADLMAGVPGVRSAGDAVDAVSDLHGSADYKRHLVGVMVARALAEAARRATGVAA